MAADVDKVGIPILPIVSAPRCRGAVVPSIDSEALESRSTKAVHIKALDKPGSHPARKVKLNCSDALVDFLMPGWLCQYCDGVSASLRLHYDFCLSHSYTQHDQRLVLHVLKLYALPVLDRCQCSRDVALHGFRRPLPPLLAFRFLIRPPRLSFATVGVAPA